VTDAAFQGAIDAVSSKGKLKWGVENLYYEVCRRKYRQKRLPVAGCLVVIAVFAGIAVIASSQRKEGCAIPAFVAAAAGIAAILAVKSAAFQRARLPLETFNKMWGQWVETHGAPPGVIVRKKSTAPERSKESDLHDYSFDRAVICDRARTVDLLLANNFHFENNCAVLSIEGYPAGPFEAVRAMLKRNPRLEVFALHDATPAGCRLAFRLAHDPAWFLGHVPVIDVGLRPRHAAPFAGLLLAAESPGVEATQGISTDEARWLSKSRLELAVIRPEQVLKRLFLAISRKSGDLGETMVTGGVVSDESSFGSDAGTSDGGADSFG